MRGYSCTFRILSDTILSNKAIGPAAKLVLMSLQYFGRNGKPCFVSNERLGEFCGLSTATVKRAIPELASHGLVSIASKDTTTPKGRRIDKLWMDDPSLHPLPTTAVRLQGQSDPLGVRVNLTLDLEGQSDPGPRGSICTSGLEGQSDPLEILLERTKEKEPKTTTAEESSLLAVDVSFSGVGREPEKPPTEPSSPIEIGPALARATELWDDTPPLRERVARFCQDYGVEETIAAFENARKTIDRTGDQKPIGYVEGILRNNRKKGGTVGLSKKRKTPDEIRSENMRTMFEGMQWADEPESPSPSPAEAGQQAREQGKRSVLEAKVLARTPSSPGPGQSTVVSLAREFSQQPTTITLAKLALPKPAPVPPPAPPPPDFERDYLPRISEEKRARFSALPEDKRRYFSEKFIQDRGQVKGQAMIELNALLTAKAGPGGIGAHA